MSLLRVVYYVLLSCYLLAIFVRWWLRVACPSSILNPMVTDTESPLVTAPDGTHPQSPAPASNSGGSSNSSSQTSNLATVVETDLHKKELSALEILERVCFGGKTSDHRNVFAPSWLLSRFWCKTRTQRRCQFYLVAEHLMYYLMEAYLEDSLLTYVRRIQLQFLFLFFLRRQMWRQLLRWWLCVPPFRARARVWWQTRDYWGMPLGKCSNACLRSIRVRLYSQ